MKNRILYWIFLLLGVAIIVGLFVAIKHVTPEQLAAFNGSIPLPLFTVMVAFVDSFNPCNFFAFMLLLGILAQASESKSKVYLIGAIFILVVFIFYYLVMAAWLNIFKYVGFIDPLRIAVGILAILAGLINCKELFFFKKGVSLMISEKNKEKLYAKMRKLREIIANGNMLLLVTTTIALAVFTSFIELLCTTGFPVIYTGVLAAKHATNTLTHYYYLALYNLIYIVPLFIIIIAIGFSMHSKQLTEKHGAIIKYVSGIIMILLGLLLLIRPEILI